MASRILLSLMAGKPKKSKEGEQHKCSPSSFNSELEAEV